MQDPTIYAKRLDDGDRGRIVENIVASSCPTNVDDPNSVLHWQIHLHLKGGDKVVILDMSPGAGIDGMTGTLLIESVKSNKSPTSEAAYSLHALQEVTVDTYISTLKEKGRTRFRYNPEGWGCRWWCEEIIYDLECAGVVESESLAKFKAYIAERNTENVFRFPVPTAEGSFY